MNKNVVVILCDQLRPDFLSCYNENSPVKTPNIDGLAKDGVLFNHAVTASPVCAPGRACMMTGRAVSDHNVWTNDVPFKENIDFLAERMGQLGYSSGAFGKLHHFPAKDSKGFDVAWQMEENRLKDEDDYLKFLKERHPEVKTIFNIKDEKFLYAEDEYYENQITNNAINFIDGNKDKPFFTWISYQGPHTPMDPPEFDYTASDVYAADSPEFNPPCEVPRYRKSRGDVLSPEKTNMYREGYVKMIEYIDYQIKRVTTYLKENNLYENTVIMFSADHGEMCGDYNMREKGPFLYKAQLEIPMIVSNHDNLPKNVKSDMLTGNLDIGSTALNFAGDKKPLAYSRDISSMFNDENLQRDNVYTEFCDSMKLISTKEYRFAYFPFSGESELVKISDEKTNLTDVPEYQHLKIKFLQEIIDYMVVSKGVEIEAQDLTPKVQEGLARKIPNYKEVIPLVFPVAHMWQIDALNRDGLDSTYNEFCKEQNVIRFYAKYWENN